MIPSANELVPVRINELSLLISVVLDENETPLMVRVPELSIAVVKPENEETLLTVKALPSATVIPLIAGEEVYDIELF